MKKTYEDYSLIFAPDGRIHALVDQRVVGKVCYYRRRKVVSTGLCPLVPKHAEGVIREIRAPYTDGRTSDVISVFFERCGEIFMKPEEILPVPL